MKRLTTNRKRASACVWLLVLTLITGCDPWDLPYLSSGTTDTTTLTDGLIAYYPFNGNTRDVSGNSLDGQALGGATYGPDRHGAVNSSLLLSGNLGCYVDVADHSKLRPAVLSVSVWINANRIDSTSHIYNKSNYTDNANQQYSAFIRPRVPLTKDCCVITVDVNQDRQCTLEQPVLDALLYDDPTFQLKRWYHIVTVFADQSLKLYLDGELAKSVVQPATPIDPCVGGSLRLGMHHSNQDWNPFDGRMDEMRLYNRALTETEVKALYKL